MTIVLCGPAILIGLAAPRILISTGTKLKQKNENVDLGEKGTLNFNVVIGWTVSNIHFMGKLLVTSWLSCRAHSGQEYESLSTNLVGMLFYLAVYREKLITQVFPALDRAYDQRYELCVKKHRGINTAMPAI